MLSERNVEIALFEIKKLYEFCTQNLDAKDPAYTAEFGLLIYNNAIMLGTPYAQLQQGIYKEQDDAEYLQYCQEMKKIIMKYIDRDDQGTPQFDENQQPKITEMSVEFEKESAQLESRYEELNKRMQEKDQKNYEFLKQKVKIHMCCINVESIPNGIPPSIVGIITKPNAAE